MLSTKMTYLLRNYCTFQRASHFSRLVLTSSSYSTKLIMPSFLNTKDEFNAALAGAGDKLVVVDYTASWCGPCQFIAPKFEEFSKTHTDCEFYKVDVDDNPEVSEEQGISAMPTFMFYRNSKKVDSFTGADANKLEAKIKALK
ncbi:thioredoxin-like [Dysidea avara]|uniref:thioredoxin-like n=1 Tax=Dysidea avara TaxID=196820 RepID=UPI0033277DE3